MTELLRTVYREKDKVYNLKASLKAVCRPYEIIVSTSIEASEKEDNKSQYPNKKRPKHMEGADLTTKSLRPVSQNV